jgi:hypothetical protein
VEVAADFESARLSEPADLDRLEPGCSDQLLDVLAGTAVVGRVEEDWRALRLGCLWSQVEHQIVAWL